ncbi:uncharacterized protein LY89DRAFT_738523 [Mollisia scopiformis]|uniref:Uncharacterized protein n=1 Tax=Mollisia scopiformis TaxID=149040 RepID=A0A194WWC7_MOLSC|nr:uncharacterized protein LY89DRAFT_738523 [Mollisia scopiformis]KUJ11882.1 hypothetical protein LY89DRAFT_738523 [Mollisia scopiformis]
MAPGIPSQAVGVSIAVLLYSSICLSLSTMLTCLLVSFGESWSYVTIFAGFTAFSTAASIAQQLHYATSWVIIKQAQFNKAVLALTQKGLAFGGAAQIVDQILFFIQFYCYNVMSLNILFWTIALFTGSWGIRAKWLGDWHERVAPISKVFSVLFPALIVGLLNVSAIQVNAGLFIFISYVTMFSSLSMGSVLLVLILYKYMKTRRLVSGYSRRGKWWASGSSKDRSDNRSGNRSENDVGTRYTAETAVTNTRRSIYDRALITRFTIGFVILALFEVAIIVFTLFQANNNAAIAASGQPDHSISGTISDIVLFIPGVTASLMAFLVFGTTKNWRQYRDLITGGCGIRKKLIIKRVRRAEEAARPQGLEFERLPSLQKSPSEEERKKGKEAVDRIKMFVKEVGRDDSSNEGEGSGSSGIRVDTERIVQFHPASHSKYNAADLISPVPGRAGENISHSVNVAPSFEPEDQVIQYGRSESQQQQGHARQISGTGEPRRFVMEHLPQTQHKHNDFIESDSSE